MVIGQGKQMLASDMLNLVFFPKGTILMYTGAAGWTDNSTLKGWYACTSARTINGVAIPDLTDKFIRGRAPSATADTGGGTVTLTVANLPSHTHTGPSHTHTIVIGDHNHTITDPKHNHTLTDPKHSHTTSWSTGWPRGSGNYGGAEYSGSESTGSASTGITLASAATGITLANAGAYNGSTGAATSSDTGSAGSNVAFNVIPAFYSLIYIIKVTNAGYDA